VSLDALPSFAARSKIRPYFTIISGLKIYQKNHFNKKCAPNLLFFNEKKIREIRMIFDIENSL
jgi:hypothetical protein